MTDATDIEALRAEVERLTAERDAARDAGLGEALGELKPHLDALPPGPWETWTSNSFRRITGPDGSDGGVLHAQIQRSDGHPDLSWTEEECEAICAIVNRLRALADPVGIDSRKDTK